MKFKYFVIPLLMVSLLSSCKHKELRSDIKDFVASFSLSDSMEEYKCAGYSSTKESLIDGVKTTENITLNFNMSDLKNPEYCYEIRTKINDEAEKVSTKELKKVEDKIYLYETNKEPTLCTEGAIEHLYQEFFYLETLYEGTYHCRGMYYGDFILENVYELQGFIEIDQENELYIFRHETEGKVDGKDAKVEQFYSVNKLGMLVENISKQTNGDNYINQEISVFTR